MEDLPEELDGRMFRPVLPFVFSTLEKDNFFTNLVHYMQILVKYLTKVLMKEKKDLFKFCPIVVCVPDDHGLQFARLEEFQHFPTTHFVETCVEALKERRHGRVEDIIHVGVHKVLPEK